MSRNISSPMLSALTSNYIRPALLVTITFKSQVVYCWTGVGNIVYNSNTYVGVGDLGKFAAVTEGTDVMAYGTTISLSGIDANLLSESLTDIQIGAPVIVYFALLDGSGSIYGSPYPLFVGTVDKPTVEVGTKELTISLALENKLANLQRANQRKYTSADQQLYYPDDCGMAWVETLNDIALKWTA